MTIRLPRLVGALLALALTIGSVAFVRAQVNGASASIRDAVGVSGDLSAPPTLAADDPQSLLRSDNLARALATLGEEVGTTGAVYVLKVEPGALKGTIRGADGVGRLVTVGYDGGVLRITAASPGSAFALERIDPAVADRLVSAAVEAADVQLGQVQYLAITRDLTVDAVSWDLYLTGGVPSHFSANEQGGGIVGR